MLEIICASCITLLINDSEAIKMADLASINKVELSVIQINVLLEEEHLTREKIYVSDYRRGADERGRSDEYRRDSDDRDRGDRDLEYESDYQREAEAAKDERRTDFEDEDYDFGRNRSRERRDEEYIEDRGNRREDYDDRYDRSRENYDRESQSLQDLIEAWLSE